MTTATARAINNRFSGFFVDFYFNGNLDWTLDPNEVVGGQRGIRSVIQHAIVHCEHILDLRYGQGEPSFKVYGGRWTDNNMFVRTDEIVYEW